MLDFYLGALALLLLAAVFLHPRGLPAGISWFHPIRWLLPLLIAAFAFAMYWQLGAAEDVRIAARLHRIAALTPEDTAAPEALEDYRDLMARMERRARRRPDILPYQSLLGMAAYNQGRHAKAIAHWERLLAAEPPNSPSAATYRSAIERARAELEELAEKEKP